MSDAVLIEKDDGVTTVTLNRPDSLNALSVGLRQRLGEVFVALKDDPATKVVIMTGAGRAFTAGLDLKELGQTGMGTDTSRSESVNIAAAMRDLGKPIIGAINGHAITGGFELALNCDILVASTNAVFADTHVRMGVVPGWGLSQRLACLVGASRAKQISLTGNYVDAVTAERWGLVNDVLAPDNLLPHCQQLARDICSVNPATLAEVHRLIDYGCENGLGEGLKEEARASGAANRGLEAETLEETRLAVQARGRHQVED